MKKIKEFLKQRLNENIKQKMIKKSKKELIFFPSCIAMVMFVLSILVGKIDLLKFLSYDFLTIISTMLYPSIILYFSLSLYFDRKNRLENFETLKGLSLSQKEYLCDIFKDKTLSLNEIEIFFKDLKEESGFSDEEINMIIRNIENKEDLKIGNE